MNDSKSTKTQWPLIIGTASLSLLWLGFVGIGLFLNCKGQNAEAGQFGDFFGCFNALVGVCGFGAVIYQLQKQREDSRQLSFQHEQTLAEQRKLFEQSTKIQLFKERHLLEQGILDYADICKHMQPIDYLKTRELARLTQQIAYLYKDEDRTHEIAIELAELASQILGEKEESRSKLLRDQFYEKAHDFSGLLRKQLSLQN